MLAIRFGLVWILLSACGDESGSPDELMGLAVESRETPREGSDGETPDLNSSTGAGTEGGTDGSQVCLFDCKTESIARLAFATPVELEDPTCSIKNFRMLPLADGIGVLSWADCLEGEQIYYTRFNLDGLATSQRRVVSPSCYSRFLDVTDFAADTDGRDVVYAYACPWREGNTNRVRVFIAGLQGSTGIVHWNRELYAETYSWSQPKLGLTMAYNREGRAYGLLVRSNLFRISPQGQQLGGTTNTYITNGGLASLQAQAGNWFLLSREHSNSPSQCSKINAQGILECDRRALTASQPVLTTTGRMVWKAANTGSWSGLNTNFEIGSFNPETCSHSKGQVLGQDRLNTNDQVFAVEELTPETHFILYQDTIAENLKLAVFTNRLTGRLLSIVSIASARHIQRASAVIMGRQLHVIYLDDAGLKMNSSAIILD